MKREDLMLEIQAFAREAFQKPELIIADSLSAEDVDTWNSLCFMQFLTDLQDHYGIKFKMMEILKLQNMGAIIDAVLKHVDNA